MLPEDRKDKHGGYQGDERGGVAGRVHLLKVGEVRRLDSKT